MGEGPPKIGQESTGAVEKNEENLRIEAQEKVSALGIALSMLPGTGETFPMRSLRADIATRKLSEEQRADRIKSMQKLATAAQEAARALEALG